MTLEEAIELIKQDIKNEPDFTPLKFSKAKQLGIEAIEAWKEHRGTGSLMDSLLLPGETED